MVPNLVGRSKDDASSLISAARLKLGSVRQEESSKPDGEVLQQSLRPNTRVPVGQSVNIVVAQFEKTIVPNLSGLPLEEVFRRIASARLRLGTVSHQESSESREEVVGQTPEPGSRVPIDTNVDLVVATSVARVKVPGLVGKSRQEADELLTAAGL